MRVLWLEIFLAAGLLAGGSIGYTYGEGGPDSRPEGEARAVEIAGQQKEVLALLSVLKNKKHCINVHAEKACDSSYVTCFDNPDAWVVRYIIRDACGIPTDGRLGVNLLIDAAAGEVISRYPELEYFDETGFCRDHADCLPVSAADEEPPRCLNFIYAPLADRGGNPATVECRCRNSGCEPAES